MLNLVQFLLFFALFIPTFIMVRKVFSDEEFEYAGYAMAIISAITTTLMLSNPIGFLKTILSIGILPTIIVILFAVFCLIPLGSFIVLLFVGLSVKFRLHFLTDHFEHDVPEIQIDEQWVPETSRVGNGDGLGISEVGKQQITKLIRAQKKTNEEEKEESGYILISSEYAGE